MANLARRDTSQWSKHLGVFNPLLFKRHTFSVALFVSKERQTYFKAIGA